MKAISILLSAGFCLPFLAQARSICNSPSKGAFSYETRLEPASPPLARDVSSGLLCTSFGAHRAMVDGQTRYGPAAGLPGHEP